MKRFWLLVSPLLTGLLLCSVACAKAPVWKVSKGDDELFLGGTIHVLSAKDYPLPAAFDAAYAQSQELVFEMNIDAAESLAASVKFLPVIMMQDGRTLKNVLKPETHAALSTYMQERGLPMAMFEAFSPAGLNLTLVVLELQRLGIGQGQGVEKFFNSRAKTDSKTVSWFETLDQQVAFISKLNEEDPDVLTMATIRDSKELATEWDKMLSAWRAGDMQALDAISAAEMRELTPGMYKALLEDRNKAWLPEIEEMLTTDEVEFVLVGALHMAGEDGLLSLLKEKGYQIEQLD